MITRLLLILLVVCLPSVARGQTGIDYAYWFDNDRSTLHSGHSSTGNIGFDADVSALPFGLHAIHIVCTDQKGDQSVPHTRHFVKAFNSQGGHGSYWFDDDNTHVFHTATMGGAFEIDVSHLTDGFHSICYGATGADGTLTNTVRRTFCKVNIPTSNGYRCWVDEDYSTVSTGESIDDTAIIDVSDIADGYHVLHTQVFGGGTMSVPITRPFIKAPKVHQAEYLTYVVTIDDKLYSQQNVQSPDGIIDLSLQVGDLSQGLHRLMVQVLTPSGAATNTYNAFFLRSATTAEYGQMKCVYCVDGSEFYTATGSADGQNYHFDLDVASLSDGLHRLSYMLSNGKGVNTKTQTQFFIKTPLGGNGIASYKHWLNDDYATHQTVQLPTRQNPYTLYTVPVESLPIRSQEFEFRIENGQPVLYARNDLHVRFFDASNRFVDASGSYVDENVREEITNLQSLDSHNPDEDLVKKNVDIPGDNEIEWFSLTAQKGDSLLFRTSKACTFQLFSPTGQQVYAAEGPTSVAWGGTHVFENGTFYLALHDVKSISAQQSGQVTLEYQKIDRYAILRTTPDCVGVPSQFLIDIEGNGFSDTCRVIISKDGMQYEADHVKAKGLGELVAEFNISEQIAEGYYDLIVYFTDEDYLVKNNRIKIEKALPPDISIRIDGNSTFLVGGTGHYNVVIENHSNVPVFRLPVSLWIEWSEDDEATIKFEEDMNERYISELCKSLEGVVDSQKLKELAGYLFPEDESKGFNPIVRDPETGRQYMVINYIVPSINGNSSYSVPFSVTGRRTTYVLSASTKMKWTKPSDNVDGQDDGSNAEKWGCCAEEAVDCIVTLVNTVLGATVLKTVYSIPGVSTIIDDCVVDKLKSGIGGMVSSFTCNPNVDAKFIDWVWGTYNVVKDIVVNAIPCVIDNVAEITAEAGLDYMLDETTAGKWRDRLKTAWDVASGCYPIVKKAWIGCGDDADANKDAKAIWSRDPNEIYGYNAPSGSQAIADDVQSVYYTIQFENDTTFATSCAHDVWVADTLDVTKLDLNTYAPTQIRIGDHNVKLDGTPNFVKTIDLRPDIYAVAQIEGTFDKNKGIAKWHFSSLDPMTMEPTNDPKEGFLPINFDGKGIGEVSYDISLKSGLAHGTEISNCAGIVFDNNEVIMTPTWTNIIDRIAPESHVANVVMATDTTAAVSIAATDELSGPWRYDVYVQYGEGSAWFKAAENLPIDSVARVKIYEGIDHGFYVVVTDSAGNVEQKEAAREFTLDVFGSLVETNTQLALAEGWNWISHNQQKALSAETIKPKALRIVSQIEELYKDTKFGWMGDLDVLLPTEMYKVKMAEADKVQLSGQLFNAAFSSIPLRKGWNWMGYPMANTMTPAEAMAIFEAGEGDVIIGQDGMATFSDGQWTGTLTEMQPGKGYMYRSVSDKNLFLNATAQNSRRSNAQSTMYNAKFPDGWTVDKRRYPNVMGVVAQLCQNGLVVDADEWIVGAFCGDECRGVALPVGDVLMMNVYGQGNEQITFRIVHRESGELVGVSEGETFRADMLGTMHQPYVLNMGNLTGIVENETMKNGENEKWMFDLQGRKVDAEQTKNGVYIVTDKKNTQTQKVVRR